MKNSLTLTIVIAIILAVGLGCGLIDRVQKEVASSEGNTSTTNSNKTLTDKAVDVAVGEEKIGIPECDEVADILAEQANNPDDDFVTKAIKATALNQFKDQIKKQIEEKKADKKSVASFCSEFKKNLQTSKEEPQSNKK